MSREIKFRAWDGEKYLTRENASEDRDEWYGPDFGVWMSALQMAQEKWELEQYTGLHDKNGVEIYEGDVIEDKNWHRPYGVKRAMIYDDNGGFTLGGMCVSQRNGRGEKTPYGPVVIGNVHENQELLDE